MPKEIHISQWGLHPAFWVPFSGFGLASVEREFSSTASCSGGPPSSSCNGKKFSTQIPQVLLRPDMGIGMLQIQICGIIRLVEKKSRYISLLLDDSSSCICQVLFYFHHQFTSAYNSKLEEELTLGKRIVVEGRMIEQQRWEERCLIASRFWGFQHPNEEVLYLHLNKPK